MKREVFELTNAEREKNGLARIEFSDSLSAAADIRAVETTEVFSHTRPDGRSYFTVLSDLGIKNFGSAEILAAGQENAA
jgi:uncharacterized protein YkwD